MASFTCLCTVYPVPGGGVRVLFCKPCQLERALGTVPSRIAVALITRFETARSAAHGPEAREESHVSL